MSRFNRGRRPRRLLHDPHAERLLKQAIRSKKLVSFVAKGCHRVVEPHVLGRLDHELSVLTFQIAGHSNSGELPNWRRFRVGDVGGLKVSTTGFPGARPTKRVSHSSFDEVLEVVDGGLWFRRMRGGR